MIVIDDSSFSHPQIVDFRLTPSKIASLGQWTPHHRPAYFTERKGAPMIAKSQPKFSLGQIVATPDALEALHKAGQSAAQFLHLHARGDWGDVCDEDRRLNDQALIDGSRLLSAYRTCLGEKLWVITEAVDDDSKRAATTILLPAEY
jgi:hypothetical protein